uniref:Uncharacterized protein n=1 Tax=Tetradesmus obliquus TaxID=3088 RepID=A0A383WP21_TETOB|eukprot:jgi/Sobl393_1/16123/SZX78466.1
MEAEQRADGQGALPLTEICIRALTRYKRFLGDVGFVEAAHLSRVLAHCTRAELESIEDCTWEGSQRDLTWCTWHLWHRLYKDNYGQPDPEQLLPLPGEPPLDYAPPPGLDCTPADYRGMLQQREADIAARRAAAADRLRANYKAENSKRLAAGVEYTTKLPPPKRAKGSPAAALQRQRAAASPARNLGGKPAGKVMQELGLARPGRSGSSSRPGPAGQQRGKVLGLGLAKHLKRPAAAAPQAQPSALACLARKSTTGAAAAAGTGHANGSQHLQQQQRKFSLGQVGSVGMQRSQAAAAAAAAAGPARQPAVTTAPKQQQPQRQQPHQQQGRPQQRQQQQQQGRSSLGLLDTPLKLQPGKQGR